MGRWWAGAVDRAALVSLAAFTLAPAAASHAQSTAGNAPKADLFRHISIQPYGEIRLGEPFRQQAHIADSLGAGRYRLRRGAFGDAHRIEIQLDNAGIVRAMYFTYAPGDFRRQLADYKASLGAARIVAGTDSTSREAWWTDGETRFGLLERRGHPVAEVSAALLDRER